MIDQFEIFKRLREYEAVPPAEVKLRIFNSLEADFKKEELVPAQLEQLQELEIEPPSSIYAIIEQRAITAFHLSFLKNYQVAPPANAYTSILERIEAERNIKRIDGGAFVKTINRYRVAIAIILIAGIGWFTYQLATSPAKPIKETVINSKKTTEKIPDTIQKNDVANTNKNTTVLPVNKFLPKRRRTEVQEEKTTMKVDDYSFTVKNNDLLGAFASFDYRNLPPFLSDPEEKGFIVQVDQYTAVIVSVPMSKMIQRMNLYRRNGKLRVRAKKTRAKLEKWKAADTEQFDKSLIKNPLDPLDLAEFIFK